MTENPSTGSGQGKGPSQAQIDALMAAIDRVERRRKIMLAGYLAALVLLVGGQILAMWVFANAPPGKFVGWIFFIPFALVGGVLWLFGRLSRKKPIR